ncbi:hypothetical protein ACEN2T_00845 [Pseudomonas sp. W22_MBD1_FP4]|uniref:hypothetical protein n=1 Tax=Pseudomonas sp. W22_MBD1_FP4 TaxID=3240272 RepID=UPI003F9A6C1D
MLTPLSSTGSPLQYAVQAPVVGEDSAKPTVQQPRLWAAPANVANLAQAPRLSPELVERDALAERLEAGLEDLPDGARTDWSAEAWDVPHTSPLLARSQAAMERLQAFVSRPQMLALLQRERFDWDGKPFRVSEGRLERLSPVGGWVNLTHYVNDVDTLRDELAALTPLTEPLGNAVYSTPRVDARQLLELKGLGSPRTVAETRNVIRWLRLSLPPAPAVGDYTGPYSPDTLSEADKATLTKVARINLDDVKPGHIGGYSIYQPANMGRSLSEVRRDIEQHLQQYKKLTPDLAALVTPVYLAQAAPEMLVKEVPDTLRIGTLAWMELRLGCTLADHAAPGTSRMMSEHQVRALTTLVPTSEAQAELMQLNALKILADWGVLNGAVRLRSDGEYSQHDLQEASRALFKQQEETAEAFASASVELPTRKALAIRELLRVFPDSTASELERMSLELANGKDRRNAPVTEPRSRSLLETYMTGDLTPGKWVLSKHLLAPPTSAQTPYQPDRAPQVAEGALELLDRRVRHLPELEPLLKSTVNRHLKQLQGAYATKLKLMFAQLPLAERTLIELGKVELFTLRGETGVVQVEETQARKDAQRGRHATLMRVEHDQTVAYYEVFASGELIKRTDLPDAIELHGVIRKQRISAPHGSVYVPIVRGTQMPFDLAAYTTGSAPRPEAMASSVIVEPLGGAIAPGELPANHTLQSFVPNTYGSRKIAAIAGRIAQDNFYEPAEALLQRARDPLPLEKRREARAREHEFLLGFVPFLGAYQAFKRGDIAQGLGNLTVDMIGVAIGAGGQASGLLRSAKALLPNPVQRLATRFRPAAATANTAKVAASFSERAFDFIKHSGLFANAALNPLDGYPQMIHAATKGLVKLPVLLAGGATKWGKTAPHLLTAEEKLRTYMMVAGGQASSAEPVMPRAGARDKASGLDQFKPSLPRSVDRSSASVFTGPTNALRSLSLTLS